MPLSRSRNSKRSSSSSYTSTITTIAFIAVCVIGVWMLTSTSVIPPQTTNRAAKVATSPFEDNPGDLPADAIINADDPKTNANDQNKPETGGGGEHEKEKRTETRNQVSEESTMTQNQQAEQTSNESPESAISAVMGSQRLPFPSRVFDLLHCARCRVPWHADGGQLLLELNRVLRPGGYFVWSATPVYQKLQEDVEIWQAMSALTVSMCWELITIKKDKLNSVGAAIYRKPLSNDCYDQRKKNTPPMCKGDDDPNAAWYVPLQSCMHRVPVDENERGTRWPEDWPNRIQTPPYWINSSQMGIYGKPAPQDFTTDYEHWKHVIRSSYLKGLGISWSNVRNVMDMRAVYGGFAAALKDLKVWVLNVVNIDSPDTLPIIYERGLFGIYHDWCANLLLLKSMRWEVHLTFSKDQEGLLSAQKGDWRPQTVAASSK